MPTPKRRSMRSAITSTCICERPPTRKSPVCSSRWTSRVGSSSVMRRSEAWILSSSAGLRAVTAKLMSGGGKSIGGKATAGPVVRTSPVTTSFSLATAPMSPGPISCSGTWSLPCRVKSWPTRSLPPVRAQVAWQSAGERARDDAQQVDAAAELVGERLEAERGDRAVLGQRDRDRLARARGPRPRAAPRRPARAAPRSRGRAPVDADRRRARGADHGEDPPLRDAGEDRPDQLLGGDLLALEVLLDRASSFSATTSMRCSRADWACVGEVVGDRAGACRGRSRRRRSSPSSRPGSRRRGSRPRCRSGSGSATAPGAISVIAAMSRRSRRARGRACSRRSPAAGRASAARLHRPLGLHLDAGGGVHDHQRRVRPPAGRRGCRPGRRARPGCRCRLTFTPFQVRWQSDAEMHIPPALVVVEVGDGGAVGHASLAGGGLAGREEHRLDEAGLAAAAVPEDRDVAELCRVGMRHGLRAFPHKAGKRQYSTVR